MLSTFQRQYIEQLTQRPDFDQLCKNYLEDHHNLFSDHKSERVLTVIFYTTDGKLHGHRLGRKRFLGKQF